MGLLAEVILEQQAEWMIQDVEFWEYVHGALRVLMKEPYLEMDGGSTRVPFGDIVYQCQRNPEHQESLLAARMWQMLCRGEVIYTPIRIQHTPFSDRKRRENQMALNKLVRASQRIDGLFTEAKFWGGSVCEDGFIQASRPFVKSDGYFIPEDGTKKTVEVEAVTGVQTRFPLEVGSVTPSRLMAHLTMEGCFARWPYGLNYIFFFEQVGWRHPVHLQEEEEERDFRARIHTMDGAERRYAEQFLEAMDSRKQNQGQD